MPNKKYEFKFKCKTFNFLLLLGGPMIYSYFCHVNGFKEGFLSYIWNLVAVGPYLVSCHAYYQAQQNKYISTRGQLSVKFGEFLSSFRPQKQSEWNDNDSLVFALFVPGTFWPCAFGARAQIIWRNSVRIVNGINLKPIRIWWPSLKESVKCNNMCVDI